MANAHVQAQRLGEKIPRLALLPPYLLENSYFVEFVEVMDEVWADTVDEPLRTMQNLRNMWVQGKATEEAVLRDEMIPVDAWDRPDRDLLVKQVNMLGMKLQNAGLVSDASYLTISRYLGQYWFQKGTQAFIEFINFCLGTRLTVQNLWTNDYEHFVPEGDASIGTPIWEGGDWYPTTHVAITASGGLEQLTPAVLISFFYEIANYNLVLQSVDLSYETWIVDRLEEGHTTAEIVALGMWVDAVVTASNFLQYGADPPPIGDSAPYLPTRSYVLAPASVDWSTAYALGEPSAWVKDLQGRKLPVYAEEDRLNVVADATRLTTFMGTQPVALPGTLAYAQALATLYNPTTWLKVPGSSRSKGRIPAYSATPQIRTINPNFSTGRILGRWRENVLVNPAGFIELEPGAWVPYWMD